MELTYSETPYHTPTAYSPNWRHEVATEMVANGLTEGDLFDELKSDRYLLHQYEYIKTNGDCLLPGIESFDKVNAIYSGNTMVKGILEALLLTHCSLEAIASDFGLKARDVLTYSLLFFDIRERIGGKLKAIPALLTHFSNWGHVIKGSPLQTKAILLKYKAVRGGVKVLLEDIGWVNSACMREELASKHSSTKDAVKSEVYINLLNKVYSDKLSGRELVDLNANFLREQKDNKDIEMEERKIEKQIANSDTTVDTVLEVLERANLRPELIVPEINETAMDDIKDKLEARSEEFALKDTEIEKATGAKDREAKLDELSNRIEQNIKNKQTGK